MSTSDRSQTVSSESAEPAVAKTVIKIEDEDEDGTQDQERANLTAASTTFLASVLFKIMYADITSNNAGMPTETLKSAGRIVQSTLQTMASSGLDDLKEAWKQQGMEEEWREVEYYARKVSHLCVSVSA